MQYEFIALRARKTLKLLTEKRARSLLQHTKLQFLVRSEALVGRSISVATAIVLVVIIGSGVT